MPKRCMGCMEVYGEEFVVCPHCGFIEGTPAEEMVYLSPGALLHGHYIIGRVLGFGGFGVTYIGWDGKLEQKVAIKEYLPSEFSTRMPGQSGVTVFGGNKYEQFHDGMEKFVDEAKRLAKFQNEPGIVKIFDSFTENDTAYIVMEYLDGETLTQRLAREKTIPESEAVAMLWPVMNSLQAVHAEGILHRDIAPDNIFLTKDGEVKLIDFGASRYATTSHSRSLTVIIKPGYSPEEQYRSRGDQGPHTDVYALAATLYKMITGKTPPDAMERRAKVELRKKEILEEPHKLCKNVSINRENAILNAMNVRVEDRTPDVLSFMQELNADPPVKRRYGKIKKLDLYAWPLWLKIALPAVLATVLSLGVLMLTGVIRFDSLFSDDVVVPEGIVVVPDVEGMEKDAAIALLTEQLLFASPEGNVESPYIAAGKIVLQTPMGGSYLEEHGTVVLTVSSGAGVVGVKDGIATVPYVIWDTEEDALTKLRQAGLGTPQIERKSDENVAAGQIISQSVEAGTEVDEGTVITLTVSTGPAAFKMPGVTGQAEAKAKQTLASRGLAVTITYEKSTTVAEGAVIRQSVAAGTSVKRGDKVTLTVSSGKPMVTVANVTGKTRAAATSTLQGQGFTVTVLENYDNSVAAGNVIRQSPSGGTSQIKGSTVVIYVSKGKQTIAPTGVSLNKSSVMLSEGSGTRLTATVYPTNTTEPEVVWSSSDDYVATVSSSGYVQAIGPGRATITVRTHHLSYEDTCTVSVPLILSTPSDFTLLLGNSRTVSMTANIWNANDITYTWKSGNTAVVTVDDGAVTAVGTGSATVTVTGSCKGVTASSSFTVTVPTPYVTLSSYSGSGEQSTSAQKYSTYSYTPEPGVIETLDTPFYGWRVSLPTDIAKLNNIGGHNVHVAGWRVVSGNAVANGKYLYIGGPGVVKLQYGYGRSYYSDIYTYTFSLYKVTSAANTIRSSTSTSSSKVGSIPADTKVYVSQVTYVGTIGQSGCRAWGKVTYNDKTGWISLFYWE